MKIAEFRALLTGKKISYFDSFNGEYQCFVVGHILNAGSYAKLLKSKGQKNGIYIHKKNIQTLVTEKSYVEKDTIDDCIITKTWKIL